MKPAVWLPALLILLASSLAFADLGPGPMAPSIRVTLLENGQPYDGPMMLTFICPAPDASDSPVGQREMEFTCERKVCTNGNWFYKFNPCFYPENGTFRYILTKTSGPVIASGSASFPASGDYALVLDVGTNVLSQGNGPSPEPPVPPSPCSFAAILFLPLVALCFHFRRQ